MTPEEGARALERFAQALPENLSRGLAEIGQRVKARAVWWSSGPLSPREQRRMGHPYARAERGQARPDPGRINIGKTGAVVAGWLVSPVTQEGGALKVSVYNEAPHAGFLYDTSERPLHPDRGTKTMVGRPLPERVLAELEAGGSAIEALEAAIGR